ncbi:hypothetical protein HOLleu_07731 [Holothuria leucospilota]|uniref:Bcl-2 Bcl-2 homology region 1-3 domain-containing protein n=1 Tax=Holothuria leucospilota TaxID=206669 RepID=A0A9Q1CH43_HOLLE|nr:hypothetical protein HOLleu_07731 [Holothuria leucospilota]
MVQQLKYDPVIHGRRAVYSTFDGIFEDEAYSWRRIFMVYVFAVRLAKYCQTQGRGKIVVENVGRYAGDYVACHLKHWIEEQGGWVFSGAGTWGGAWRARATNEKSLKILR